MANDKTDEKDNREPFQRLPLRRMVFDWEWNLDPEATRHTDNWVRFNRKKVILADVHYVPGHKPQCLTEFDKIAKAIKAEINPENYTWIVREVYEYGEQVLHPSENKSSKKGEKR